MVAMGSISPMMQCEYAGPTGVRCTRDIIDTSERWCAIHCPADELDLSSFHAGRLRAAKYRIAQALPDAAEVITGIMANEDSMEGNRLKASLEVLDRGGLPRVQATILQGDITTRVAKTAGQMVTERLAKLAERTAEVEDSLFPEPARALPVLSATVVDAAPDTRD